MPSFLYFSSAVSLLPSDAKNEMKDTVRGVLRGFPLVQILIL
jgi:hypothetical protein